MELANLLHDIDKDKNKEIKGTEVHYGDGFFVTVARAGNPAAVKMLNEIMAEPENERARRAGAMQPEKFQAILVQVAAKTILVGWRGLTRDGSEVPYSVERATVLLSCKDFLDKINAMAGTEEIYRRDSIDQSSELLGKL